MSKPAIKDKNRSKGKINPLYKKTSVNVTAPLIIHFLSVVILCLIMFLSDMNVESNYFLVLVSLSAAYFLSAYFVGRHIRKNGIVIGIVYNILPTLIYIFTSLSLNSFSFDYRLFIIFGIYAALSSIGGIIAVNSRVKTTKRKK